MSEKTGWWRSWEITIDSNWITTILMAVLLVVCGALLINEIVHCAIGNLSEVPRLGKSLLTNITNVMIVVCYFSIVFSTLPKLVKISFSLMGVDFASRLILGYCHVSNHLLPFAAINGSI